MSHDLRRNLKALDTTTTAALAILATGSGYWTYMGVRGLLDDTGVLSVGGAFIYSVAVSVAIFAFWAYLIRFLPAMRSTSSRVGLIASMITGSVAIVAMSSWLNAAALAGSAAVEQHLATATEEYQQRLEQAHENALAAETLLPDLELAAARFEDMAASEESRGALTGTSGHGTVVALLTQTADQLSDLAEQIRASRPEVAALFDRGSQHLVSMRRLTTGISGAPIDERTVAFAEEAIALTGVITALEQSSVAPAVRRAADDFATTFVRPAPSGGQSDLGQRQEAVVESVAEAIGTTSAALSAAAADVLARPDVAPFRFEPVSAAEAVLMYAGEFVPSWAGAIAIDMMPAVLVLILMVIHGVIRAQEGIHDVSENVTVAELNRALVALERLNALQGAAHRKAPGEDDTNTDGEDGAQERGAAPSSPVPSTSTVTPIGPTGAKHPKSRA